MPIWKALARPGICLWAATLVKEKKYWYKIQVKKYWKMCSEVVLRNISFLSSVIIWVRVVFRKTVGKWFEPRSISCLSSVIVWVRVVFRKTVGKWFQPRSISCLSGVIVRERVVFRKIVGKWFEPRNIRCLSCVIWVCSLHNGCCWWPMFRLPER